MKKKYIIIFLCIFVGCILFFIDLYYEWMQTNATMENNVRLASWLASATGLGHLLDALSDLGIGLIGSAIFLILVDWTIANAETRIVNATELESKRREIAWKMRYSPEQVLDIYKVTKDVSSLFTNQFFQGCNWSSLNLDGLIFSNSDLSNTDLSDSNLVNTDLSNCILNGVVFKNARLTCANFKGSNVSEEQLKEAYNLWNSIMPDGETYDGRFMLNGDVIEARRYGYDILDDEEARKDYFSKREVDT